MRKKRKDHQRVVHWNLEAMTEKVEEAARKVSMEIAKERAGLDVGCMEDDVEQEATWCQKTLRKVLDFSGRNSRICAMSKKWSNSDIKIK